MLVMLALHAPQAKGKNTMAQDQTTFSFSDYDGEKSNVTINTVEITAANLDAQATLAATLRGAINAIILGGVNKVVISDTTWDTVVPSTDPFSQREIKWVIIAEDTAGNRFRSNEIPMANLVLLAGGNKYIVKNGFIATPDAGGEIADFVAAYEAFAVSNAGLPLSIVDMYQAGRNS